jgi:CHASE2 domain-containing sensor protein
VLAEAAAAVGHVRAIMAEDGRIRALPLVFQHGDKGYPSLALELARIYTGTPPEQLGLRGYTVTLGAYDIPVSASGEVLLDWPADGEKAFPQYSFLDVVRGDVPDEAFQGKAVLVAGTADDSRRRSFLRGRGAGVLVYATFWTTSSASTSSRRPMAWLLEWGSSSRCAGSACGCFPG